MRLTDSPSAPIRRGVFRHARVEAALGNLMSNISQLTERTGQMTDDGSQNKHGENQHGDAGEKPRLQIEQAKHAPGRADAREHRRVVGRVARMAGEGPRHPIQ